MVGCTLVGCTSRGPQRPSQRKSQAPQPDSTQLALLELNQQLTQTADEQLARFAREAEDSYALYERGTWAFIRKQGSGETVQHGEICNVKMRIYSLSGRMYMDCEQSAQIGRNELIEAIDENITEWRHGAEIILLAPWYAAFGIKGTEHIPPYENVRIELTIP